MIAAGTAYNDPGAVATIGGRDVSDEIKVSTQLDFADPKPGYYTIVYSVVNSDGFAGTTSRDVIVASVGDEASGFYTVQPDSYRDVWIRDLLRRLSDDCLWRRFGHL